MDLAGIKELLELGNSGFSLFNGATTMYDDVKKRLQGSADRADEARILEQVRDLLDKLIQAQLVHSQMMNKLYELERAAVAADRKAEENARYELVGFPTGYSALRVKGEHQGSEPVHYLCQQCQADGKKRILQPFGRSRSTLECPDCKVMIRTADEPGSLI